MSKTLILADSTCDLPIEIINQRNIKIVPLKVVFNDEIYKDGIEINPDILYKKVDECKYLPKTSATTIDEFVEFFNTNLNEADDIIFISISSELSSSYQHAMLAINELDSEKQGHVYVIDSRNLSTGIGLLVLKANDYANSGMEAKEIANKINELTNNVRAQFSVKDLEYLHKGGRCSGTSKFFGTLLRIHPILRVINGFIVLSEKVFGRYGQALDLQIKDVMDSLNDIDTDYLFITHSSCPEEAEYIISNLPDKIKQTFKSIIVSRAGCVITSHCGPHTIGMLYIRQSKVTK